MTDDKLTVFYDGACPLCRREIAFYRRRRGCERVEWRDISDCDGDELAPGLDRNAALRRFHVRTADGRLVGGGAAFAELWSTLPQFAPVGRIMRLPGLRHLLDLGYSGFLKIRPTVQKLFRN